MKATGECRSDASVERGAWAKASAASVLRGAWLAAKEERGPGRVESAGVLAVLRAWHYVASQRDVLEGCARLGLALGDGPAVGASRQLDSR